MRSVVSLILTVVDPVALRTLFEQHLSKGRAFVPDAGGIAELSACELVLEHAGRSHRLAAEVVYVRADPPGRGVGLQLAPLDAASLQALRVFVDAGDDASDAAPESERPATGLYERIRSLSTVDQQHLAASGTLPERIALERMYGQTVWETLLRNPRLTIPEAARIGRKGTLPRPLVELIAANAAWLAAGEVQRALLSNPRSSPAVVAKVLLAMPRGELALVPQQTAYPASVRAAARKALGR